MSILSMSVRVKALVIIGIPAAILVITIMSISQNLLLSGLSVIIALSMLLLLDEVVLQRLGILFKQVSAVRTNWDPSQNIVISGNDELSVLAQTINTMAHTLHESYVSVEKKVQDRTEELRKAQARLESSIDSLRIGFIMTDNDNEIVSINGSAKLLLTNKELQSRHNQSTASLTKNWTFKDVAEQLQESFDLKENLRICLSEMKPLDFQDIPFGKRYLHIFISPVIIFKANSIGVLGTAILVEDITEVKIIQKSKEEFFSIASHELRTPLTAIRGNTSLIRDYYAEKIKDQEIKGIIDDIHESSVHLIDIVNEFLNMSRLEQGRMSFKIIPTDAKKVITESISQLNELAKEKNIYIRFEDSGTTSSTVYADDEKLKEVILNLIGNAIKFTDVGGITISMSQNRDVVTITVTDTGKGIDKQDQELLFRKFEQARKDVLTKDTTQGSGLGLYISKLMIEGMKGDIYLKESEIGKGATFVVELPVA